MQHLASSVRSIPVWAFAIGFLAATATAVMATPRDRGHARHAPPDYVVAESSYGHGSITGPVRAGGRGGYQVRLPGGNWVDCGRSCSDTLRRQTVDFWENVGRDGHDHGRGYLSRSWGF